MGGNAFWNFRRQGGVKTWKLSVVEYGYFLELPIEHGMKLASDTDMGISFFQRGLYTLKYDDRAKFSS